MSDDLDPRIDVDFTDAEWAAVQRAAAMAGVTVEDFIVEAARVRAEETIRLLRDYPSDN